MSVAFRPAKVASRNATFAEHKAAFLASRSLN